MNKPSTRIQFTEAELSIITLALNAYKDYAHESARGYAERLEREEGLTWREAFTRALNSWVRPLDTAARKVANVRQKLDAYHWEMRDYGDE